MGNKKKIRRNHKTYNPYITLLVKLYNFLVRRMSSNFNSLILKCLISSKIKRKPISTSSICKYMKGKNGITVVVGTVTDDERICAYTISKNLKVCALNFTRTARAKITKFGGNCLSFDQLALLTPKGSGVCCLEVANQF